MAKTLLMPVFGLTLFIWAIVAGEICHFLGFTPHVHPYLNFSQLKDLVQLSQKGPILPMVPRLLLYSSNV